MWPVVAALLSSCASISAPREDDEAVGWEDPEGAIAALRGAWNAGDPVAVGATFHASRRADVLRYLTVGGRQLDAFEVVDARVLAQCHPRGTRWKTGVLKLRPRTTGPGADASFEEIVWIRLHDDHWFMYSL